MARGHALDVAALHTALDNMEDRVSTDEPLPFNGRVAAGFVGYLKRDALENRLLFVEFVINLVPLKCRSPGL